MQTFKDLYQMDGILNNHITVLSKGKNIQLLRTHCLFGMSIFLNKLFTHFKKHPFSRTVDLILIVMSDIIIIVMNTDKKISFLFKIYKNLKN